MSEENINTSELEILEDLKEALNTAEKLEQSQEQKEILHKLNFEIKKEFEENYPKEEDGSK